MNTISSVLENRNYTKQNVNNVRINKLNNVNNVRTVAHQLSEKYNDHKSFKFFCRVAMNIPEPTIWDLYELSLSKNKPVNWFSAAAKVIINGY